MVLIANVLFLLTIRIICSVNKSLPSLRLLHIISYNQWIIDVIDNNHMEHHLEIQRQDGIVKNNKFCNTLIYKKMKTIYCKQKLGCDR